MASKTLNIGIMSRQDYIQRTIAITKVDYQPQPDEPKIWLESIKSMVQTVQAAAFIMVSIWTAMPPCWM